MYIDRYIDKCIDNETDMLPGVETEIQSEVGTDFDKEIYSRDDSANDSGDDVTAWYWILFGSNKKYSKRFWVVFGVSGEGSEVQFGRSIQTRIRPKQNKSKNKRQINRQTKDKLSVKSKTK